MKKTTGAGKKKQPEADGIDEVEELLKLTQDDLFLKLSLNSHIKSKPKSSFNFAPEPSHSNAIDPDLDRRFQALRSKHNPKSKPTSAHEDVDDLFARFAALKAPSATAASGSAGGEMKVKDDVEEDDEEDEVKKIIDWAVDAARLDPSPSSDVDDDDDDDDEEEESDDDDDDESDVDEDSHAVARKNKGSKK